MTRLDPAVGTCTEDIGKYGVKPVTEALCEQGTYIRRYALFSSSDDLDTAWNWFGITSTDTCTGYGGQTWSYNDIDPAISRGRIACFGKGDLSTGNPQLMFTYADSNILGVIIGDRTASITSLTADWDNDDGLIPPAQ